MPKNDYWRGKGFVRGARKNQDGTLDPFFFISGREQTAPGVRPKFPVYFDPDKEYEIEIRETGLEWVPGPRYQDFHKTPLEASFLHREGDVFEIFREQQGPAHHDNGWRWRQVAANGQIIASSGESFTRKWSAKRAAKRVNPNLPIKVV